MDIRSDRKKGLSYTELGRKYHMDPRTALSAPEPTKLDAYKQIVDEWLEKAPYSAIRILEKLREMGFNGGYSIIKAYVSSRKMDLDEKATVRFETTPGKQGQMDRGSFEDHLVYEEGKWKRLYCFLKMFFQYLFGRLFCGSNFDRVFAHRQRKGVLILSISKPPA